jgi:pimeloyl-ACP methyl ester carboxylesterase
MRSIVVIGALAAALLSPTAAPAAASGTAAGSPPASSALSWHDCHDAAVPRLECATVRVPVDWGRPHGPTIALALDRLPATDPQHRVGPLLVNPGGPGGSGFDAVEQGILPLSAFGSAFAEVFARFDVIGFDPRGVGRSAAVQCPRPLYEPTLNLFPTTRRQYRDLLAFNRRAGAACARQTGTLLSHVDGRSVARDVDAIRAALGVEQISWFSLSYGTELGSTYAEMFPRRVRAMVLDGAIDHSLPLATAVVTEARAGEDALQRFADWCRDPATRCDLPGRDALAAFDALVARADRGEIVSSALGRPVTAAEITDGVYQNLTLAFLWPDLAGNLAAAASGDATLLTSAASFQDAATLAAYRSIGCHDFPPAVRDLADLRRRAAAVRAAAPRMWRFSEFWSLTAGCVGWPVPPAYPPRRQHVVGVPTVLIVGNTHDPATPYPWAVGLSGQIAGSRLLTYDGDGHTAMFHSECARVAEADYLVSLRPPAPGTICRS